MNNWSKIIFSILLFSVLIIPVAGTAGSIWVEPRLGSEIRLEGFQPQFKRADFSTFSMIWFLSGNFEVNPKFRLVADIPYARFVDDVRGESTTTIGNPYVGMTQGSAHSGFMGEIGMRLPLAADDEAASMHGAFGDPVDRMEAFLPEIMSFVVGTSFSFRSTDGVGMRVRIAPIIWLDTGDTLNDGAEIYVRYSAQGTFLSGAHLFGFGFSGRYLASEGNSGNFGDKSIHEFGIFADLDFGRWRPSARIRLPLDDKMKQTFDPGFVLSLGVGLF